jgi:hypothetical protein
VLDWFMGPMKAPFGSTHMRCENGPMLIEPGVSSSRALQSSVVVCGHLGLGQRT